MFKLLILVQMFEKLFTEVLIAVGVMLAVIGALWAWDRISPQSFERALTKLARYFK